MSIGSVVLGGRRRESSNCISYLLDHETDHGREEVRDPFVMAKKRWERGHAAAHDADVGLDSTG